MENFYLADFLRLPQNYSYIKLSATRVPSLAYRQDDAGLEHPAEAPPSSNAPDLPIIKWAVVAWLVPRSDLNVDSGTLTSDVATLESSATS